MALKLDIPNNVHMNIKNKAKNTAHIEVQVELEVLKTMVLVTKNSGKILKKMFMFQPVRKPNRGGQNTKNS